MFATPPQVQYMVSIFLFVPRWMTEGDCELRRMSSLRLRCGSGCPIFIFPILWGLPSPLKTDRERERDREGDMKGMATPSRRGYRPDPDRAVQRGEGREGDHANVL